jgi:homopolymeric O-antigen transport system permease protein
MLSFTRREIVNRYAGSVSGLAWTLLHPLAQLAIFGVVFSRIFRIGVPAEYPGVGYVAFLAVALWPWLMFSDGLQRAMACVAAHAELIRKVAFPHRLLVFSTVLASCAVHCVGFLVVLLALRLWGEPLRLSGVPFALGLLIPYMLLCTGIGALLAALQTLLRDVEHVLQVVMNILFYVTPILYPITLVPESMRRWVELNPIAWFSERMRVVLFHGGGWIMGDLWVALGCVAAFIGGLWVFERLSPHFEDFL